MEPHRDRTFRQQRGGVLADHRIGMLHAKHEKRLAVRGASAVGAFALPGGELVGSKRMLRAKITRAYAVGTPKQTRRLLRRKGRQCAAKPRDFVGLSKRHPDVTSERIVTGKAFVGALENDDVLPPAERVDNCGFGKRADHIDVDRANLGVALLSQVVACRLNIVGRTAQRDEHGIGILGFVFRDQPVAATGERSKLGVGGFEETENGLIEIVPPRDHTIHVMLLILHRT